MSTTTTNYGLTVPELIDSPPDITLIGANFPIIDTRLKEVSDAANAKEIPCGAATGTANTYAITLNPAPAAYTEWMALAVKINVASTAASTLNVNGLGAKSILKPNGTPITNLKSDSIYTLRYNGANFIVQGSDAAGNATAADILAGKTASTDAGDVTGTMPNKTGSGTVITPSTADQTIPQGYYGGAAGDGKVAAVSVPVANVLTGTTIAGADGTMPNRGAAVITPGTANQAIAAGYHNGSGYVKGDANLIAANILSGKNIFGVAGSVIAGRRWALGTDANTMSGTPGESLKYVTVSGLSFRPKFVLFKHSSRLNGGVYAEINDTFNA
ncbi:MAG TPA: hypothetical protein VN441_16635, partial [Syntrophomonas sp.]|nr:hypothetical protein [Syntrophomonas sp.]